jgi:hypothetical protein
VLCLSLLVAVSRAEPPAPAQKGFWRILVQPKQHWVLVDTIGDAKRQIVVETYDVRKVGGADVARLRWTYVFEDGKEDWGDPSDGRFTQVALTDAGLYVLSADMDDAKVAEALKRKPSRSDPPKPYKGTKRNSGRYLSYTEESGDRVACFGWENLTGECEDTCMAEVCLSATRGFISVEGQAAPENGRFAQKPKK